MKQENMIALGLAAVAVYLITQSKKTPSARAAAGLTSTTKATSEIFDTSGNPFSNGWRYFTDGTAINPKGDYYYQGQLVWQNPLKMVSDQIGATINTLFDV